MISQNRSPHELLYSLGIDTLSINMDAILKVIEDKCGWRDTYILWLRANGHTLKFIGKTVGITKERVRQISDKMPAKCRKIINRHWD